MSQTKTSWSVIAAAWLLVLAVLYALLIVADSIAGKIFYSAHAASEPIRLESARAEQQDRAMIAEARRLGFHSLVFPELFDEAGWRPLAEKHGIAPLAAQPLTRLYYCNEGYGQLRYRSDRFGFRNDDAAWDRSSQDLVLIGDSYGQGACQDDPNTIAGHLKRENIHVLNLSTGGNGPVEYAALAKTFLPELHTRYAVILFYPNDNIDETQSIYRRYFLDARPDYFRRNGVGHIVGISVPLAALYADADRQAMQAGNAALPLTAMQRLMVRLSLTNIRMLLDLVIPPLQLRWSSQVAIDTLAEECRQNHCTPVAAYIPDSKFWRPDHNAERFNAQLRDYARHKGVKFVDTTDAIRRQGRAAYGIVGPHLSPLGYGIVAAALQNAMTERRP